MTILTSSRLRYEPIDDRHVDGMQAMNRDPEVMRYILGRPETPDETRAMIARARTRWAEWGYSWWALIDAASGELVGAGGTMVPVHELARADWRPPPTHPASF